MGIVKAVVLTYNTSGNVSNRKSYNQIINASISKDGERVVDSATLELPANTTTSTTSTLSVGNGIYYIQDIADTAFLSGIWNMHYNILDESGNDLDATSTNEAVSKYSADSGARFTGNIYRSFSATGDEMVISDPASRSDNLTGPLLSFVSGFDFYVWMQCSDTSSAPKYILDREDTTNGIAIYVSGGTTGTIKLDKWVSSTQINIITGSTQVNDGNWHFIRVNRDNTGTFNLYVDNVADGTPVSDSTSYQNSTPSLIIGNNSASAGTRRPFIGNMFQARFYTGGVLSSSDTMTIFNYKPQPYTMKFGGTIWQVTNNTDSKTIQANGFSQILANVNLRPTGSSDTPVSYNNVYTNKTPKQIITDIVTNWFPGWTLEWIPSAGSSITQYIATGNLLQNLLTLLYTVGDNLTFWTNSRKVLYVETLGYDRTDAGAFDKGSLVFIGTQKGGRYDITQNGTDSSVFVNDLTFIGNNDLSTDTYVLVDTQGVSSATFTMRYPPQNVIAYVNGIIVPISSTDVNSKKVVLQNSYANDGTAGFGSPVSTVVGVTGTRRYTYRIGYKLSGTTEVISQAAVTNSGNSTLTTSNYNTVSNWQPSPGIDTYDILVDQDPSLSVTVNSGSGTDWTYAIVPKNSVGQMLRSHVIHVSGGASPNNTLNWSAVNGESAGYDVLRASGNYTDSTFPTTGSITIGSTSHGTLTLTDNNASASAYTVSQKSTALVSSVSSTSSVTNISDNGSSSYTAYDLTAVGTVSLPLVVFTYQYEGIATGSSSNPYGKIQDVNSIQKFGDYSKTITMTGYKDLTNGQKFAANYFLRYSNNVNTNGSATISWSGSVGTLSAANTFPALIQRITINAGTLVNCIRENMKVGVVAGLQGQTYSSTFGTASNSSYSPIAQIIKSYTYKFPEGQTTINVGDFVYDMYDPTTAQASGVNQATQQYTTVKNV